MIPDLIEINGAPWKVLPAGIHSASLSEIKQKFAFNQTRRELYSGLLMALSVLANANVSLVYLDGSFVTEKPIPGDYDACWDAEGVDVSLLDPVFLDFSNKRFAQKRKYQGEFFPAQMGAGHGEMFLDFFQVEKYSNKPKGIVLIDLTVETFSLPLVHRRASK